MASKSRYKQGGWPALHFTAFLCVLFMFLLISVVYYSILLARIGEENGEEDRH